MCSGFRIAPRTMQSDGQQCHFGNLLISFVNEVASLGDCGLYTAWCYAAIVSICGSRAAVGKQGPTSKAARMKKYRFIDL